MKKNIYIFLIIAAPLSAQNNRYYVDAKAGGANNGLSWADAFTDLQTALQSAQAGDEVWVAAGTYRPTATSNRAVSFEPRSGVRLYGGFAGTENSPAQRDWTLHPSVLSGDIGVAGDSADNAYNVMYLHQPDSSTLVDGFTLRDGLANASTGGAFDRGKCGAGLYIMGRDWEAYPTVRNCTLAHNTARNYGGGAMVNGTGDGSVAPRFVQCRFENNRSLNSGGGLAWLGSAWVQRDRDIDSCTFINNYSTLYGGGFYFDDSDKINNIDIHDSRFDNNTSITIGSAIYCSIGKTNGSMALIRSSSFLSNSPKGGSVIYFTSSGFNIVKKMTIDSCLFLNNIIETTSGSVVTLLPLPADNYLSQISNCSFYCNTGNRILTTEGAGKQSNSICLIYKNNVKGNNASNMFVNAGFKKILLNNNTIDSNLILGVLLEQVLFVSQKISNCLFFNNSVSSTNSIVRHTNVDSTTIYNCTFLKNKIKSQGSQSYVGPNNLFFLNCAILEIPGTSDLFTAQNQTYIAHSSFDTLDCSALPAGVVCGPGILTGVDPMFVNPDSADFRLQACSPLVDAGSNAWLNPDDTTDLAGLPRIRGGTVDIGAYEMQGPALAAPAVASPSCPGGASGSLAVDLQGACPPLHVAWSSASAAGQGLQGLPAGDYGFTVTDARGQSIAFSASVPTGDSMTLLSAVTPVLCGQTAGGSASATLKDGLPPFSWNWYPGPAADSLRTNLPAGDYLVTVTDARGCAAAALLRVDKSGSLDIDIQVGPISCHGAADGYFSIVPLNGKAPFSWLWDTGADSSAIGPIGPGTYNGAVTDALGCTLGWVLPLDEPGKIAANALVTPASDSLTANGAVELMPTGGTPPFTAHWNTGAAGLSIDSLAAGTYSITLTDANDCTLTENIAVGVTSATGEPTPAKQTISLLPNPATDLTWLTFDQPLPKSRRLRLWNTAALLLLDMQLPTGTQRLPLRLDGLPKGLYFVEVGGVWRKLVVD